MSNRNFDSSYLTRRQGERQIAKNIVTKTRQNSSTSYNNISTNYDASIINQIREGQSMTVTKGVTCTTVEPGCPCGNSNITTYPYDYQPQPQPIFNPGISYDIPNCTADGPEQFYFFPVIFGAGTPTGGTFAMTITPPIPPGPPYANPATIDSVTGIITIPGQGLIDPASALYVVTYTVGSQVFTTAPIGIGVC